jgi:hypothetical protein
MCHNVVVAERHTEKEPSAMQITTSGLDLAKNLFQVHAVDDEGQVVLRRRLAQAVVVPFFATLASCRIGVEACGTAPSVLSREGIGSPATLETAAARQPRGSGGVHSKPSASSSASLRSLTSDRPSCFSRSM